MRHRPALSPPPMRNDCFALPAGVDWIPVETALAHLKSAVSVQSGVETLPLVRARGRILAQDVQALTSHPPHANTAVDGYGFAGGRGEGVHHLPLANARAAAGQAPKALPQGHAMRILTGAVLPQGVDTVVLQEDVTTDGQHIAFQGPIKRGSNTRRAGEDVIAGDVILTEGRLITPADLGLAATVGLGTLPMRKQLRVGVLSTGEELVQAGGKTRPGQIYDANRPMLLSMIEAWGMRAVDLGHVGDDRSDLRARFNQAAAQCDVIITSGGASAGDEDHVSALLCETGSMQLWRIAVKPGRPLALGMWQGAPVFGLPGNPVAAFVCTLIFARPALMTMAGAGWLEPEPLMLPAAFAKNKKPGRREYLRARLDGGRVQRFTSEGSGRISGLSWATGLVELPHEGAIINEGDLVRYLPFAGFGL